MKNNSIHLQDFPDVNFLSSEENLSKNMDMVRQICSVALFIRDGQNLRVRLPLRTLKIIGKNAEDMLPFKEIIANEINVKEVIAENEIGDLAELKLQLNFKKIGAKLGSKMKDINFAARQGNWQRIVENKIEIAGEILEEGDFELKLIARNPQNTAPLPSNDCLVELDTKIDEELEAEGLARDLIRAISQNRKEAGLEISDRINICLACLDEFLVDAVKKHENYIKEQVLANKISYGETLELKQKEGVFINKIADKEVCVLLEKC